VKIGLERIDTQEGITVEALLDSGVTGLVMSSEFARKQGFKLKKLERPMNVRNMDGSLNKEGPIENMVEVNIYYKTEKEKNSGSKESSGGMGDMGERRRSSEIRSRSKEAGAGEVSLMNKGIREEAVRKDADKEGVGSCNRCKGGVCSEEGKGVPIVERRERGGEGVY